MERNFLLDAVSADLFTYVLEGAVSEAVFSGLVPDTVPERYQEYETLVDLHFLLTPGVQTFIEKFPDRLRRIHTETARNRCRTRGEIDGRINWSETIAARHAENPHDQSLFVVENRAQTYETAENIVLKRLLLDLKSIIDTATTRFDKATGWIESRWELSDDSIEQFKRIITQNVHINRIRDPKEHEPTERMVTRAADSRSDLYRDAAALMRRYQELQTGDRDAFEDLIRETAITPSDDDRLFELYILFETIKSLETAASGAELRPVEPNRKHVAHVQGDHEYYVYYDQSAGDRDFAFKAVPDSKPEDEYTRTEWVVKTAPAVWNAYFSDRPEQRHHTKRPDVFVIADPLRTDGSAKCLAVEVKHSTETDRLRAGIRETLEYVAYMQQQDTFVFDTVAGAIPAEWNGLLVTDTLTDSSVPLKEQAYIKLLQGGDNFEENVGDVINRALIDGT